MADPIVMGTRTRTSVPFHGEFLHSEYHLVRVGGRLDAAAVVTEGAVAATLTAAAVAGATSITVAALTGGIPAGTVLDFGGAKFARVTATAAAGATTLTVAALPTALAIGDTASYVPPSGKKTVPAGTLVGRVRATENLFGPYATGDDEFYLTAFDVIDAARDNDVELIVVGKNFTVVPERLPGWAALPAAQKTLVFDNYKTIKTGGELS